MASSVSNSKLLKTSGAEANPRPSPRPLPQAGRGSCSAGTDDPDHLNHLPLLRHRLRRQREVSRRGSARGGRHGASGQFRPAVCQGLGAGAGADAGGAPASSAHRRRARELGRGARAVAARFGQTIAAHGPDSVALYVSGQLLTEDYYVANKLMKGFVGSANIDTNSRLCMSSSVAGHKRAFGADTVPGCYEDLERGRPRRARRLQSRMVPSGALPAPRRRRAKSAAACRALSISTRAARRPARSPIFICRSRRAPTSRCSAACCANWGTAPASGPKNSSPRTPRAGRGARWPPGRWTLDKVAAETGLQPRRPATAFTIS